MLPIPEIIAPYRVDGDWFVVEQIARIGVGVGRDVVRVLQTPEVAAEVADPRDFGGGAETDIALEGDVPLIVGFGTAACRPVTCCPCVISGNPSGRPVCCGVSANCVPGLAERRHIVDRRGADDLVLRDQRAAVECVLALIEEVVEDAACGTDGGLAVAGQIPRKPGSRTIGEVGHVVIPPCLLPREALL